MNEINSATFVDIDLLKIKRMIPHRFPLLLIDKVTRVEKWKGGIGHKSVTNNEPQFQGHFPDNPIMPGVYVLESMAQTAAIIVSHTLDMIDRKLGIYLVAIDNAKFRRMVAPGDNLELHMKVVRQRRFVWKFEGEAKVSDRIVAEASITAMWELLDE